LSRQREEAVVAHQSIESIYGGPPILAWFDGVPVEEAAKRQLQNLTSLPFVTHVAAMPDCHFGIGATVGSVIATKGAIIPAAVGVDIGCVDADTEFLTSSGWKRIADYKAGDDVLIYDPDRECAWFEAPQAYVKRPSQGFHHLKTKYGIDHMVSSDHRLLTYPATRARDFAGWSVESARDFASTHARNVQGHGSRLNTTPETVYQPYVLHYTDAQLRVIVMTAADASLQGSAAVLNLRKRRKFERALRLLVEADCEIVSTHDDESGMRIRYRPICPIKELNQLWGASSEQLRVIAEEVLHWDGNEKDHVFFTRKKAEADFVQWAFLASGKRAVLRADADGDEIDYRVFAHGNTKIGVKSVPKTPIEFVPSPDGLEYCFTVSTGFFLVRRGGVTVLTGNCGMMAVRTTLTANDLPESLSALRTRIERAVPHGGPGPSGGWNGRSGVPNSVMRRWMDSGLETRFEALCKKHPKLDSANSLVHLGTLGGGNHFIEVCLDAEQRVWVMLHSGSRGIGNRIGQTFIEKAREMLMKRHGGGAVPDKDLAWFEDGEAEFKDYVEAVAWGQDFARHNREAMMQRVLSAMREVLPPFTTDKAAVNCHHNYVQAEDHFGQRVFVTRKGAVRAGAGDLGIIPGSMGAKSYIVRGLGNADSLCSCSHGAGRKLSRSEAKRQFSVEDVIEQTAGVECRTDAGVIDEIPAAYKSIDDVMAAQSDLVSIEHTLRQVLCVKG
jgi:tRNA-splicing ligase RtcB